MSNTALRDGPGASAGYPFTSKVDAELCPCLVDIQVMCKSESVTRLAVSEATALLDLKLVDVTTGQLAFNSAGLLSRLIITNNLRLAQWETDDLVVCVSMDISSADYVGNPLPLCDRVVYPASQQLESIVVETTAGDVELDPRYAVFKPGYNCELEVENQTLIVSAIAGSGLGQYQDCLDELNAVRSIARTRPSAAGNIQLSADDCLRISPELIPTANGYQVSPGRWYFHDDCEECCRCEEKAAVWVVAKDLQDKLAAMVARYQVLRNEYNRRSSNIESGDNCTARPLLNADLLADINDDLSLYISVCNGTNERINDIKFKISPFAILTAGDGLIKRYYPSLDKSFFAESPGMITVPDEDGYFYSLHEAIRGKHRVNFVPQCGRGYIYSIGGKNHIKQPGTISVIHHPYVKSGYRVIRNPVTNSFDILNDGGLEIEFQCLEPGDTRYLTIGITPQFPVGEPTGSLTSTNLAFLVYSTTHQEINVSAKSGFGFGIDCDTPEEE